ncbi:hypothetical protein LEP1GSC132_3723 [Leptospira kirschneri str. 200803703]|nr:hypothetical protein LEP1GSC132_3723 [Leptospira kirschneri str. 200803703]EMO74659.1 hypothetical protein LEP1GSC127_4734 [Leptospira kirschneri str. 200801925]
MRWKYELLKFVLKIVICNSSQILKIHFSTFFRKMNHDQTDVKLSLTKKHLKNPFHFWKFRHSNF